MTIFGYLRKGIRWFSKGFFVVAVFFTIINLFIYLSHDNATPRPSYEASLEKQHKEVYAKMNNPQYSEEDNLINDIYRLVSCKLTGYYCTSHYSDAGKDFQDSYLGFTASLFTAPYAYPVASGTYYVYDSLKNADFIPSAYADEGIGFAGLKPLLGIWKKFRDIAYLILVFILVAIGFMIMFRRKLDPHTVIGIESALPRIVVTLILITFSFPIAGFMIDFMYVLIALMIIGIGHVSGIPGLNPDVLIDKYLQAGPDDIPSLLSGVNGWGFANLWDMFATLPNALIGLFGNTFEVITRLLGSVLAIHFFGGRMLGLFDKTVANIANIEAGGEAGVNVGLTGIFSARLADFGKGLVNSGLAPTVAIIIGLLGFAAFHNLIFGVLIFFTLIFLSFRILFMLFSSYLKILILVLISPLLIMFEAIPGKSAFSKWFKGLFAELLTFPLLIGIFLLGTIIFEVAASGELIKLPFFYKLDTGPFSAILGFGFLFMTPDLIKIAKKLMVPESLPLPDVGPGVFFGGATSAVSGGLGKVSSYASAFHYIKPLQGVVGLVSKGAQEALFGKETPTRR
ncbi:hypothetical protein A2631_00250 [Candidatus Daviesbacteria bacterium RIFCSPHIGHO2_01_FULL_44_29]|uniref:Uncharacterized protein n=1 Tax=Candidatus Roizmanbacteria bacterium RIFCSPLOWO2_01_FULL_41_22 TaxID=1802067 RepID=A0A1F7JA84_9BACT|nr:MAG: hypothetical protein A2631_00250 [Candidatus Daviesbacteria bacterium RIFCSPHIGHO2_01_FULL_44_29]OGK52522.1 MAG: hypothetical protein A2966_05225 [Candidatus Roizmanbacteria bacterium RIFCSPLOWO2_01_FULL_41_22]